MKTNSVFQNGLGIFLIFLICLFIASASDFSQWRGPERNGIYPENGLINYWPETGPTLLWTADGFGDGYSSVAVANEKIYSTAMIDRQGFIFAHDLNGKLLWKKHYGPEWYKSYPGARTTPTVKGDHLYIFSGKGTLICLNSHNGDIIWQIDMNEKYDARMPRWGFAESLLIVDDRIICTPGGKKHNIVAFNRFDGALIWSSSGNKEKSSYCSPVLIEHNGNHLILTMMANSIIALNVETGSLLWKHPHKTSWDVNPNTPIYHDGFIYCVSGYGTGGVLLELSPDGKKYEEIWRNETLDSQMDATILFDGYIYGSGQDHNGFHCLDWKTGKEMYVDPGLGKGNIIAADGLLYFYSDRGEMGLIKPNPHKFELVSSFKVEHGTEQHWAHPVIAGGVLYIRHGDTILAYDISE